MAGVTVYLAGPIIGLREKEAKDWRKWVKTALGPDIIGISPLRCEPAIDGRYTGTYEDPKYGSARAIHAKNKMDVRRCDAVLAYLPQDAVTQQGGISIGTVWEIGQACALNKPVVIVSDVSRVATHPAFHDCWVLSTLEEAVELLHGLFDDYVKEAA